jgi:NADH dehydrogenase
MTTQKPRVVILGAGFGGLYTLLKLREFVSARDADVTIINRNNYFLFTPLLHEVATGSLSHHQVVESIRSIIYRRSATLHVADVERVDLNKKVVETTVGPVSYDYLVIATGATTAYYGIPGVAEHALVLKDLRDAIKVRNRLIGAFETAVETKDPALRKRLLTFVVVGGGATGVELATEMVDLFYDTLEKFFCKKVSASDVSIHLVSSDPELLKVFHPAVRARAQKVLAGGGVNLHFSTQVKGVDGDGVILADGSRIDSEHVFWLAGVTPNTPVADGLMLAPNKRVVVDESMRVRRAGAVDTATADAKTVAAPNQSGIFEHVYALGDVATFEKTPIPMLAQVAVQQAPVVAGNIALEIRSAKEGKKPSHLQRFAYHSRGELVSLGRFQAAGRLSGITLTGPFAWFVWRTVYFSKFASWPKRIKIAVDWTIDLFYPRDITRA